MVERQILTADEAERERAINVRIKQAVASDRWVQSRSQQAREDVAFAVCVARTARLVAAETERCAAIAASHDPGKCERDCGCNREIAARIRSGI
jgi:hypothetical protein